MILGVLSDTHGHENIAATAVSVLKLAGAQAFVHCGDVGGEEVLDLFAGLQTWFVWGNCDDASPFSSNYARSLGLNSPNGVPLCISLAGRTIAVFHGHEALFARISQRIQEGRLDDAATLVQNADYVLSGHTHQRHDVRVGTMRFINPGALHRAHIHSVATIDLREDVVRYWRVDADMNAEDPPLIELPPP